jgi:hypothetical protein
MITETGFRRRTYIVDKHNLIVTSFGILSIGRHDEFMAGGYWILHHEERKQLAAINAARQEWK